MLAPWSRQFQIAHQLGLIDGAEVIDAVEASAPHVVLMDLRMPRIGGLEATRRLQAMFPEVKVIALTAYAEDERVIDAVRAGASGYLQKNVEEGALHETIRAVYAGRLLLDASAEELLRGAEPEVSPATRLTPRERDVIKALAAGMSNRAIAKHLGLSEKTVKNHISRILAKLELSDRTQAALYAVRHGMAEPI